MTRSQISSMLAKAPLFGTMRHELVEETIKDRNFSSENARIHVRKIVRRNADSLVACDVSSREAEAEVMKVLPQLQKFANEYTTLDPLSRSTGPPQYLLQPGGQQSPLQFVVTALEAVEEPAISPELGLKGNIDMVVEASTVCSTLHGTIRDFKMMSVELKTGHNQNTQSAHMAQLALYTLMLQSRYGRKSACSASASATAGDGVLLYMNNESIQAVHIAPCMSEIKSLICNRNSLAIDTIRAARPRGVQLLYQNDQDSSNTVPK